MFIDIKESEYLTSDSDVSGYLETFREIRVFNILIYRKVLNSTNIEKIGKFMQKKRHMIGFNTEEEENEDKNQDKR